MQLLYALLMVCNLDFLPSIIIGFQGNSSSKAWELGFIPSGSRPGVWTQGQFPIVTTSNYRVMLEFTKSATSAGYVGVDDVIIRTGKCQSK